MRLGIDAANIRAGGGVTHLVELLRTAEPAQHGFAQVVVWSARATLERIEDRPWLVKVGDPMLERSLPWRAYWQQFRLADAVRRAECTVLFVPGGSYAGDFQPVVTMSQNMLPFEWREARRYGVSTMTLRLLLLRWSQARTLRRAAGVIFLSEYARARITAEIGSLSASVSTIPHGIDPRFLHEPRAQRDLAAYDTERPMRAIYVSSVDMYKHQWHVAEAVVALRAQGLPLVLDLVGPAYPPALKRLRETLRRIDPAGAVVRYVGPTPHSELPARYAAADLGVFASSCENLPNILIECMASGLPIACSNRGPMPEVLGEGAVYFDPESSESIARALSGLVTSRELRERSARDAFESARAYSWERCSAETLEFLARIAHRAER
jgi:glycosyltransferase involved in cell wall biosynthesis